MGTPENILIKAGLFLADDLAVSPADRLTRLLRPLDPMADELLPILVQMEEVLRRSWEMRSIPLIGVSSPRAAKASTSMGTEPTVPIAE